MKQHQAKWAIHLTLKSTFGDKSEPPSEIDYKLAGGWHDCGALTRLARDLVQVLRVASTELVPVRRDELVETLVDEIATSQDWLMWDEDNPLPLKETT